MTKIVLKKAYMDLSNDKYASLTIGEDTVF